MVRSRNGCWKVARSSLLPLKRAMMSACEAGSAGLVALIRWQWVMTVESSACATM